MKKWDPDVTPIDTYAIYCSKKGREGEGKAGEEQEEGVGRRGRGSKRGRGKGRQSLYTSSHLPIART